MVKSFTRFTKLFSCLFLMVAVNHYAAAQVSINPFSTSYSQNFDGLPASGTGTWVSGTAYFPGWYLNRTVTSTTSLLTGTGSSNSGGVYSYGLAGSTDRALGAISSASSTVGEFAWGLLIQNNTGATITSLNISFTGEQWRSASTTAPEQATTFWYALNSDPEVFNLSPKSDAGWTSVKELDFWGPVYKAAAGALDGNAPANKRYLSATIPVSLPNGHYVMLRWKDLNDLYDDHGLAIDDFSMTWGKETTEGPEVLPVELVNFTALVQHNTVHLHWITASEKDNSHFIVERSHNGKEFTAIATINGYGTTVMRSSYSFTDLNPLNGMSFYRLKQVDSGGASSYSKTTMVKVQAPAKAVLYPTITSDVLYLDVPDVTEQAIAIVDMTGKEVYSSELTAGKRQHLVEVGQLKSGAYSLLMLNKTGQRQVIRFVKL